MERAHESLRDVELFAGLSDAERMAVASTAEERRLPAGEVIFRLGEKAEALHVILRGRVDLTFPLQILGETREIRFQSLDAGRTLAWSALVPPFRLTMSARATTEVELLSIPGERLRRLLAERPSVGRVVMGNLAAVVAARFHELQAIWVRELQRSVPQR